MRKLVTYIYCDMCVAMYKNDETKWVDAVHTVVFKEMAGVGGNPPVKVTHILELCNEHNSMLRRITEVARPYLDGGAFVGEVTSATKKPAYKGRKPGSKNKSKGVKFPCKWCDKEFYMMGFHTHVSTYHPEVDREERLRYAYEARAAIAERNSQE